MVFAALVPLSPEDCNRNAPKECPLDPEVSIGLTVNQARLARKLTQNTAKNESKRTIPLRCPQRTVRVSAAQKIRHASISNGTASPVARIHQQLPASTAEKNKYPVSSEW